MRGQDVQQSDMFSFSYLSPEQRVRADHPLRAIRAMADQAPANVPARFDAMYATTERDAALVLMERIPGGARVTLGPTRRTTRKTSWRKVRRRGIHKAGWVFTFAAAAYNLVGMRNLLAAQSA